MPELPDVTVYAERMAALLVGRELEAVRVFSPFWLRTVEPPLEAAVGKRVAAVRRLGKRLVVVLEEGPLLVLHLMIAGRLHWRRRGARPPGRAGLGAFDFTHGTLLCTEQGSKKRASLHVVAAEQDLAAFDRGGLEVLDADLDAFRTALLRENRTLKRALTDPRIFSGIGNAYSDEILFAARLSPVRWTSRLSEDEVVRLFEAAREVLRSWTERLRAECGEGFPEKVTAFREGMAVHGRHRRPCPVCGSPVQRIRYADRESNYCAVCQNEGRLLADRGLSKLLGKDWPRTLAELEERLGRGRDA